MKILLYSDDINLLDYWESTLDKKCKVIYELDDLNESVGNIVITNFSSLNNRQKEIINHLSSAENKVIVLHRAPNIETAREVLSYGAKAYGNALMKAHFILTAIRTVTDGLVWLHPEFISELIAVVPTTQDQDIDSMLKDLTKREKEVAILLKDGYTYKSISEKLNIKPRTVKAHAQSTYKKLHVKDRLSLAILLK